MNIQAALITVVVVMLAGVFVALRVAFPTETTYALAFAGLCGCVYLLYRAVVAWLE